MNVKLSKIHVIIEESTKLFNKPIIKEITYEMMSLLTTLRLSVEGLDNVHDVDEVEEVDEPETELNNADFIKALAMFDTESDPVPLATFMRNQSGCRTS